MTRPNFLATANPYNLRTPPAWFLASLAAYDSEMVIFASEKEPLYRMGRRGRYGTGMLNVLAGNPDTKIFVDNLVWPWKSVLPESVGMRWARVLLELPEYDTQRFTDPAGSLDAREAKEDAAIDATIADGADQLAGSMYRTLGLITGSRVGGGTTPTGAGYRRLGKPARAPRRHVRRPTAPSGTGAIWVGGR